jgi:hypothetical protein
MEIQNNIGGLSVVDTRSTKKMINRPKIGIHSGTMVFPYEKNVSSSNFVKIFDRIE